MLSDPGGKVTLVRIQAIKGIELPGLREGIVVHPTLSWLVESGKEGEHEVEVSYLTTGIGWHAEYVAVIGEGGPELHFSGWVSIHNRSGVDYPEAELRLVAGQIHRVKELPPICYGLVKAEAAPPLAPQVEERPLFEYHLYTFGIREHL